MKNLFFILLLGGFLFSCGDEETEVKKPVTEEVLIETKDGIYYEYYPGKKQVKITGPVDENNERNGKWSLFNEKGKEMSWTMYEHGKKHGHSFASYPNGKVHYVGEYWHDTLIGVWKTYDEKGKLVEKDYGQPAGQ